MSAAKRSPRAMPVETIITRYKSAQQRQQQHQTQKQQQHSGRHRIQKQQQHSGTHRIQKQQQHSGRHRIQKQQLLTEQHKAQKHQKSDQNSMHIKQHTSEQPGTEKQQQLPEQHGIQKEQQVTTEQQKIQNQQQVIKQQYSAIVTKNKSTSKSAKVEKPKQVKSSNDFQKNATKIATDEHPEFYPEKRKRIMDFKRVVLRPKHRMKIIGGTKSCNKRKLHMPQKDVKRIRHEPESSEHEDSSAEELSVEDMVRMFEEGEDLEDDDLLAIITCPSPVWWEDKPSELEEPIFVRQKPTEQKSIIKKERRKQRELESLKAKDIDNLDVSKLSINLENRGDKFMKKRCKLESLLGSIKNKVKKVNEEVDLNIINNLSVKKHKLCNNIAEDKNLNKNQNIEVQESNTTSIESVVDNFNETLQYRNDLESKLKYAEECIKILESNIVNSKILHTNDDTKSIINRKTDIIESNNSIRKLDEANQNNINNISTERYISADLTNREKKNTDSFEDDAPLDLEDHEILSLENMNIPIAPIIETNSAISVRDPIKTKDIVYPNINNLNKINKNIFNAKKQKKCMGQKISQYKGISDEIVKSIDLGYSKLIKIDNLSKEIKKFSFIRVKKLETLNRLSTEASDITCKTSSNAIDDNKKGSLDDNLISKNEGKIIDTSTIEVERKSNYNDNNLLSNNKSVRTESSHSNIPCNCNTDFAKDKPNECGTKNFNKFNKHLSPIIDPIVNCDFIHKYSNKCNKITGACEINSSSFDIDYLNDHLINNHAASNKITENYDQDKNIKKNCDIINNEIETNVRRYSVDSAISDKNMSVEYLDQSLLDEDENKMDIKNHNYESDEQSQESNGICKNINFKSDLDMSDSNMYDQINKLDNNDIIQYIRDNHKETQHLKDKYKNDNRRFDLDFMKNENFRSSSPINQKIVSPSKICYQNLDNKDTEYVSVFKIINSDSESDGNVMTDAVKIPTVNKNDNQINVTDVSEMNSTAFNENKDHNSQTFAYEEEDLTEFNEVSMAKNELNGENINKPNEVNDARNINSDNILMNTNEASATKENMVDSLKLNEVEINGGKLTTPEVSKKTDKVNEHNIKNKHKPHILRKIKKNNPDKLKKTHREPCSMKDKSILISVNNTVKYCLVCSCIYDTEDCKYCLKKLKEKKKETSV